MADNNTLYIMEAANLVCGDAQAGAANAAAGGGHGAAGQSTHLAIQSLKLPALEENYADHNAGGGAFAIEVPTHFQRLECTFNLAGWQPNVMKMIAATERSLQMFTAYGLIRNRMTGDALQAVAVMQGRLGRVNPTDFRRGDLQAHEFSIRAIVHYELYMQESPDAGPSEIYRWDFFTSQRRIGGFDTWAEYNRILATGGGF